MTKIPNPGSSDALKQGCTCAVLDNGHGDQALGDIRGFWITGGCPLHDDNPKQSIQEHREAVAEILVKWSMPTRQVAISEICALIDRAVAEARKDELSKACHYWEENPTLPATYMIDRTAELTTPQATEGETNA